MSNPMAVKHERGNNDDDNDACKQQRRYNNDDDVNNDDDDDDDDDDVDKQAHRHSRRQPGPRDAHVLDVPGEGQGTRWTPATGAAVGRQSRTPVPSGGTGFPHALNAPKTEFVAGDTGGFVKAPVPPGSTATHSGAETGGILFRALDDEPGRLLPEPSPANPSASSDLRV